MLIDAHVHLALNHLFNKRVWESAIREKIKWIKMILEEYKNGNLYFEGWRRCHLCFKLAREIAGEEGMIYNPIYALYKRAITALFWKQSLAWKILKRIQISLEHKDII